jgi:hypothetical protein
MSSEIERHLVPANGPQVEPIKTALNLLTELCEKLDRDGILLVPTKANVRGTTLEEALGTKVAKALSKGQRVGLLGGRKLGLRTERTFWDSWTIEVIIAVYPTQRMLDQIDSARNAAAVIVVAWIMDDVREWRRTWNPHVLGEAPTAPEVLIENPVVEEALKMLTSTVNLSTGLTHPSDKEAAVQLFRQLYKKRELYDPNSIRAWALRNGWAPKGADQLRDVAQAILDRRPIRGGRHPYWRRDIIKVLREQAKGK